MESGGTSGASPGSLVGLEFIVLMLDGFEVNSSVIS
jgi:hypothetical protein